MAHPGRKPGPVNLRAGNVAEEWNRFKQKFSIYLIATQQQNAASAVKWAILMGEAGDEALGVYNSFKDGLITRAVVNDVEVVTDLSQDYERVIQEFDSYAAQKKSLTACRQLFNTRNQKHNEPFSNWLTDLRNLMKPCEYGTLEDSLLKDRLVLGVHDKRLKLSLRGKPNYSLQEIIDACKVIEANGKQETTDAEAEVDTLQVRKNYQTRHPRGPRFRGGNQRGKQRKVFQNPYKAKTNARRNWRGRGAYHNQGNRPQQKPEKYQCKKCDQWHGPRECPAYGQTCHKCGQTNHFATVCRNGSATVNTVQMTQNKQGAEYILEGWKQVDTLTAILENEVHQISTAEDDEVDEPPAKFARKEYTEVLKLAGEHYIQFKLDPGSEVNIIPMNVFQIVSKNKSLNVTPRKTILKAFGNTISTTEGSVKVITETQHGERRMCEFLISKAECRPILGIEDCARLNLVKRVVNEVVITKLLPDAKEDFIKMYESLFTGLGKFKQTVKITVDPKAPAGMCPPRRYSYSITERLKGKLEALESIGVVAKVTDQMPKFISNLVIREKGDGDLRLCLDPENLNQAIVRQNYTIPTLDEISCKVKDKKYFTVLDLKDGFWHATLDQESSLLCSFTTPYGIYKFLKLPFGVSCAPEIFQFLNDQVFSGTGALSYFDDCLIAGETLEEHDRILRAVMKRATEETVRFNPKKLQYRLLEAMFLGLLWSYNKIKIDPNRTAAIQALHVPKTRKQLQKAIGVFNHLRKFIPQMSTIAAPLFALMSKKVHYQWLPVHAEAFQELKDSICRAPALVPFDSTKAIVVQADASQFGLGACLLQNNRLVASASRQLTVHEQNWAQIEKEMLALTYAADKFDKFIYGMTKVLFQTDHKPLVSIYKKPIHKITNNRLKKLRLKMLKYQPKVEYIPGKHLYIADILSRQFIEGPVADDPDMVEVVHEVTKHLPISAAIKEDFVTATAADAGLQAVMTYYMNGWPKNNTKAISEAKPYWKFKNDLFVEDGLVILDNRLVVPVSLRAKVLAQIHTAHLGVEKTKARARQYLFWPGITNDIVTMTSECRICERHSAANYKEPLIPHKIPELRFQKVSCDILTVNSQHYLVVEDNLSKWLEIKLLSGKSSRDIIEALRSIFSTHGIPEEIFGDNNPLNSYECKEYAASIGSKIITSSPHYPRSNGLAEKGVDIASKLVKKSEEDGKHFLDALREYNNTPLSGMSFSPAQALMSRICRTVVPTLNKNLEPQIVNVIPELQQKQDRVKKQHDKHARRRPVQFTKGDQIVFRKGKQWRKGVIVEKHTAPRSYIIKQYKVRYDYVK